MTYKSIFFGMAVISLATSAWAIQNSQEYLQCMKTESSDAGTARCYENEVKYFRDMAKEKLPEVKKLEKVAQFALNPAYDLEKQYQAFNNFLESYCKYYVKRKQNQGYSDKYLQADCELGFVQMYAGYTSGLIAKGTDPCGEE